MSHCFLLCFIHTTYLSCCLVSLTGIKQKRYRKTVEYTLADNGFFNEEGLGLGDLLGDIDGEVLLLKDGEVL